MSLSENNHLRRCLGSKRRCPPPPPPAQAQWPYVTSFNGVGTHFLFPYWSTENATNTNVHLHRPAGVMADTSMEEKVVVKVAVRDAMNKVVASLKICFLPADSWTATLSEAGLTVVDPGGCDAQVELDPPARNAPVQSTPKPGEVVSLGGVSSGWLDAWVAPTKGLVDGSDADTEPDHGVVQFLAAGSATLISAVSGFSSTYLATPLVTCGKGAVRAGLITADGDDGDGCWTTQNDGSASQKKENGEGIRLALGDANHDPTVSSNQKSVFIGGWTALDDANVQSRTKLVLTLPMNHLTYTGTNADGEQVAGTDPVSLLVFDGEGKVVLEAREVLLAKNVNTCTFLPAALAQEVELEVAAGQTVLSCNGAQVGTFTASSGTFRLFNNTVDVKDTEGVVTDTGAEAEGLGRVFPPGEDATQNGQSIAEGLGVVGLNFSYFRGTDTQEYDQVIPIGRNYPGSVGRL